MSFYNPQTVQKQPKFQVLPKGTYRVMVSEAQGKPTQSGRMLSVTYDVIEGTFQRRKLFKNFVIEHPKQDVVDRAWSDWRYFLEALGINQPFEYEAQALAAVRDKVLLVKVGHEKDKQSGELRERVQDFLPDGDVPAVSGAGPTESPGLDEIPFAPL